VGASRQAKGAIAATPLSAALLSGALLSAALLSGALPVAPAARALELRGSSMFVRPPWRVELVSYTTTVGEAWAEYFLTVELPAEAGASLGELLIQQTRGVDRHFNFITEQTRAFLGRPRRQGEAVAVNASFDGQQRLMRLDFPQPVPPGSTLTVRLKPWANPVSADTYLFKVTALPAGPDPVPAPLGFGTLRIYQPDWR
jgi:hypothetical protein